MLYSLHVLQSHNASWFPIGYVWYIEILTWLRDFEDKLLYLVLFSLYPSLFWEMTDKKKNLKKVQFLPESLGAMLEYVEYGSYIDLTSDQVLKIYL